MTSDIRHDVEMLDLLDAGFFAHHWRRRPTTFRGAAGRFLTRAPDHAEIKTLTTVPTGVQTDGRSIWFLESMRDKVSGVAELCAAARAKFDWDDVWCDVFLTEGSSSIGAHIDNSDNFTIQLEGVKRWRLGPPGSLSPRQRRLRILGEPDVGNVEMIEGWEEFTLEPGDVLYIPLLWRHWGISAGDSLSMSLVINSRTVWQALSSTLVGELRHEADWYEPLAIGPEAAARRRTQLATAVRALAGSQAIQRTRRKAEREVAARTGVKPIERLDIDMAQVKGFIASAPKTPERDLVLATGAADSVTALNALLARKNLKDLLKLVLLRFGQTTGAAERELYQACVHALTALGGSALERTLTGPDITSWIAVAKQGSARLPVPRQEDPLAHQLAFFLLPELVARSGGAPVPEIRVEADRDGGVAVPRLSLAVAHRSTTGSWSLTVGPDGVVADDGDGTRAELTDGGSGTIPLRRIADGPVITVHPSRWLDEHLPPTEVLPSADASDVNRFHRDFTEAAELLGTVWPEAWAETRQCVERLLPMPWAGLRPHNYSIHAFRGQIVSSPRPALMAAQTLVHETGHNRMSTLIDLLPLCTNPDDRAISPVVNADRPLTAVFHGCYSFAREIHLTWLMVEQGIAEVPTTDIRRYLAERTGIVRAAWDLLRGRAELLSTGETIVAEVGEILDRVS